MTTSLCPSAPARSRPGLSRRAGTISAPCISATALRPPGVLKKYQSMVSACSSPSLSKRSCTRNILPRATACSKPWRSRSSGGRGSPLRLRPRINTRSASSSRPLTQRGLPFFCAKSQKRCSVTFSSALSSISGTSTVKNTSGTGTKGFFPDGNPGKGVIKLHPLFRRWIEFQVTEAGLVGLKIETDFANRPITMFSDNDVCDIFAFGFRVVNVITIDEHDDIRVLLYTVVNDDITCDKVMQLVYCQVVDVSFAIGLYCNDLVPVLRMGISSQGGSKPRFHRQVFL